MFPSSQAAEKEAALAQQEEEKAEQRKRARAEKKALKKKKKTRGADKRKAEEDDEKEWGDDEEGRAFWKCCLGTSLTSREVTGTIHRTFCLEQLRISCQHGAPSPFLSLPAVHIGIIFPPYLGSHSPPVPALLPLGLKHPAPQLMQTPALLACQTVLPWWSFPSSASLAPAISGAGRCGAGLFWQSPLR